MFLKLLMSHTHYIGLLYVEVPYNKHNFRAFTNEAILLNRRAYMNITKCSVLYLPDQFETIREKTGLSFLLPDE